MNALQTAWQQNPTATLATAAVGIAAAAVVLKRATSKKKAEPKEGEFLPGEERDVVYLHAFGRWAFGANASSPCCKLEAYLRLAKIDFKYVETRDAHPRTKKLPFIRYNGYSVPDSNLAIQYLIENAGAKDFDAHLSPQEKATMLAVLTMVEESLYFEIMYDRWIAQTDKFIDALADESSPPRPVLGFIFHNLLKPKTKQALYGQGTGRFSEKEILERSAKEIAALSAILGSKSFFGGDKLCLTDISAFAALSGCLYTPWSKQRPMIEVHENLVAWCDRVKDLAYPDWDEL